MSFILDALRKSETERQRQSGPGLVDAGYRPRARRTPLWIPILALVLMANLVVMGVLWLRREPSLAPTGDPAAQASPTESTAVSAPAPIPAPSAAADTAEPADQDIEEQYAAMAELPAVEEPPVTEVLEPPPEPVPAPPSRFLTEGLPTAQQLIESGVIPPEDLRIDLHVYSSVPAERFAFINMRKYVEGERLPTGAHVDEITKEGVVLSQNGQRFLLPRD